CGVNLKPWASTVGTMTGLPSFNSTMSGYDTQYGVGMMTSSPASSVACSAEKISCLAPVPTTSWSSENDRPFSRLNFCCAATSNSRMPDDDVYLTDPLS